MLIDFEIPHWYPVLVERFNINPELARNFMTKSEQVTVDVLAENAGMVLSEAFVALAEVERASVGIFPDSSVCPDWTIYLDTNQPSSDPLLYRLNKWDQGFSDYIKSVDQNSIIFCNSKDADLAYSAAMAFRVKGYIKAFATQPRKENK